MYHQLLSMPLMHSPGQHTRDMVAGPPLPRTIVLRNIVLGHPVLEGHSPHLALPSILPLDLLLLATKVGHTLLVGTVI
jgi:hypothetical protein